MENMKLDKAKQIIAMVGGFLSSTLMFLGTLNVKYDWFTVESIDAFVVVLGAAVPLAFAFYGIYKNTFLLTKKAKIQEDELKRRGLK